MHNNNMEDSRRELVFASNNPHKLSEVRRIVGDRFKILSLAEIGCHDDIPETADTLAGNSLLKARWVKERYGYDCFADDTGLIVEALGGAPGVLSARYAGPECRAEDNMRRLLSEMEGVSDRRAAFETVITLITGDDVEQFTGRVEGTIATERDGEDGFGYDPVFIAAETGRTFASMDADAKNASSHRGRAMRKLADRLAAL